MEENALKEGRINDQLGQQLESISAQIEANVERGRNAFAEWKATLGVRTRRLAASADEYAHTHPWPLVCGATALGVVLGYLCARD